MGHRLIVFAQPTVDWVPRLLGRVLEACKHRPDVEWVKVCATSQDISRAELATRSLAGFAGKALFNPRMASRFDWPRFTTVTSVAKQHGIEVIEPPRYNINDPDFIHRLELRDAPTMALSLACLQIFRAELLKVFDLAVNFHNGYLPDYKGLWATHWSVYQGEACSGYAFHVMDQEIDTGPIIRRGRVPIGQHDSPAQVERRKIAHARQEIVPLLDAMLTGTFESESQPKGGSYFSGKASTAIWTIDEPGALSAEELFRRLRCFAPLQIRVGGVRYPMSSLKVAGKAPRPLAFKTADGVTLAPDRLQYLPTWLYLATKRPSDGGRAEAAQSHPSGPQG